MPPGTPQRQSLPPLGPHSSQSAGKLPQEEWESRGSCRSWTCLDKSGQHSGSPEHTSGPGQHSLSKLSYTQALPFTEIHLEKGLPAGWPPGSRASGLSAGGSDKPSLQCWSGICSWVAKTSGGVLGCLNTPPPRTEMCGGCSEPPDHIHTHV